MLRLNSPRTPPRHTVLPDDPVTNQVIVDQTTGARLVFDGDEWQSAEVGARTATTSSGVAVRSVVTVENGVAALTDPTSDQAAAGIVVGVTGTIAVIRYAGPVDGFAGLTAGSPVYAGAGGTVTHDPDDNSNIVPLGHAESASVVNVQPTGGT